MPSNPSKLPQLWQELKRRKVVRVITVYAAAAFVILELVDIVTEPFGLPEWTLKLVVVLLTIGLIISIILSWIYDIHPDGGIVKTEPAHKIKTEELPKSSSSWKIASYISFIVIVVLIVLNIIPRSSRSEKNAILDKSIAVLPFINDSPDEENAYFINGTMEAILDNLSKIKDLRVVSRTSVEQYRNAPKPIPEIAEEMRVSYILEGSGQKYGNQVRLTLQLIDAVNDQHVWSSPYVRVIEIESIFTLQSEIAQLVAAEIEAIITPEEKQRIEKIPTKSQTAYDLYQKAGLFFNRYSASMTDHDAFKEAVDLYHYAIEYDSTFAEAYLNLGIIYFHRYRLDNSRYKDYLDSAMIYSNIALGYDPQLAGAYSLKGSLLNLHGKLDQGITALNKALEFNPNSADAYNGLGWLYQNNADYVNAINSFYKSTTLDMSRNDLERGYFSLGFALTHSGFIDHAKHYFQESLKQNGDSIDYYWNLAYAEHLSGNFEKSNEISRKALQKAPNYLAFLMIMGKSYIFLDDYKESYVVFDRLDYLMDSIGAGNTWFKPWMSFAFMKNDQKERAIDMADQQIIQGEEWISTRRSGFQGQYSLNALAYAIKEDTENVLFSLNMYNQREAMEIQVVTFRDDPIFDKVRDHPEFKRIYKELEAKYFVEHERVRQWLEENNMLEVSSLSH